MTKLVNELLAACLRDTPGWTLANAQMVAPQGTVSNAGESR
ncbi:MAG: hypothetical protein JWO08_86 [Verrucomicrobiaceae bacterium]|nr:hypothetical protein [Verrucomicrobiaceae bacterium]